MAKTEDKPKQATDQEDDQSMEEILQSIRRIITEDENDDSAEEVPADGGADVEADVAVEEEKPAEAPEEVAMPLDEESDSDVLELTEIIEEAHAQDEAAEALDDGDDDRDRDITMADIAAAVESESDAADALKGIDSVLGADDSDSEIEIIEAEETRDTLVSKDTADATAAIIEQVKNSKSEHVTSLPYTRAGVAVEDLIIEGMRPMLKEWLDENLEAIVERVVQNEIKKIAD